MLKTRWIFVSLFLILSSAGALVFVGSRNLSSETTWDGYLQILVPEDWDSQTVVESFRDQGLSAPVCAHTEKVLLQRFDGVRSVSLERAESELLDRDFRKDRYIRTLGNWFRAGDLESVQWKIFYLPVLESDWKTRRAAAAALNPLGKDWRYAEPRSLFWVWGLCWILFSGGISVFFRKYPDFSVFWAGGAGFLGVWALGPGFFLPGALLSGLSLSFVPRLRRRCLYLWTYEPQKSLEISGWKDLGGPAMFALGIVVFLVLSSLWAGLVLIVFGSGEFLWLRFKQFQRTRRSHRIFMALSLSRNRNKKLFGIMGLSGGILFLLGALILYVGTGGGVKVPTPDKSGTPMEISLWEKGRAYPVSSGPLPAWGDYLAHRVYQDLLPWGWTWTEPIMGQSWGVSEFRRESSGEISPHPGAINEFTERWYRSIMAESKNAGGIPSVLMGQNYAYPVIITAPRDGDRVWDGLLPLLWLSVFFGFNKGRTAWKGRKSNAPRETILRLRRKRQAA